MNNEFLQLLWWGFLVFLVWAGTMMLVDSLADRKGVRHGWLDLLTFLVPISAFVSIPALLARKPNIEGVRSRLKNTKYFLMGKAAKEGKKDWKEVSITDQDIAQQTDLRPWYRYFMIYIAGFIVWLIGFVVLI